MFYFATHSSRYITTGTPSKCSSKWRDVKTLFPNISESIQKYFNSPFIYECLQVFSVIKFHSVFQLTILSIFPKPKENECF